MKGFRQILLVAILGAAEFSQGQEEECEKAVIILRQPVEMVCQGTTTQSAIDKTYTDTAPTTCVSQANIPQSFPFNGGHDDCINTMISSGAIAGTTTLPNPPAAGAGTAVVIATVSGGFTTITTEGPTPGTTTLPAHPGESTTVIVTTPNHGLTVITVHSGTQPGTTTLPVPSDETTIIVTVPSSGSGTTSSGNTGVTILPSSSGSETTAIVTTIPTAYPNTFTESTRDPSTSTSTTTSPSPSPTCPDLENGDFHDGSATLPPWYISDQVTADSSGVVDQGSSEAAFALIPSQQQYAQVYLNQQLPSCGSPPPEVTLRIKFRYEFTGSSEGCRIGATVNRDPTLLVDIRDDGLSPGVVQMYEGDPIQVQLTYDPLFTLQLVCEEDTANKPAILITDISVY